MGNVKNKTVLGKGRGKPRGPTKLFSSRDITECCVNTCSYRKRNDKVVEHQRSLVLFNDDGTAASEENPDYKLLSNKQKLHTDHFRGCGATNSNFPSNKVVQDYNKNLLNNQSNLTQWLSRDGHQNIHESDNDRVIIHESDDEDVNID